MNYVEMGQQVCTNTLSSITSATAAAAAAATVIRNDNNHVVIEANANSSNITNSACTSTPIELVLDLCGGDSHLSRGKVKVLLWRTSYNDTLT